MALDSLNRTLITGNFLPDTTAATTVTETVYRLAELGATNGLTKLSDKRLYPNFSRIFPSDVYQARTVRDTILHYGQKRRGWTDIALLFTTEDAGLDIAKVFVKLIGDSPPLRVVATRQFVRALSPSLETEMREIKRSGARVIVAFVFYPWAQIARQALKAGLLEPGYVWFVSDYIVAVPPSVDPSFNLTRETQGVLGNFAYLNYSSPMTAGFLYRWFTADKAAFPGTVSPPNPYNFFSRDAVYTAGFR